MKKKLFSLLSLVVLALAVCSCGDAKPKQNGAYTYQTAPREGLPATYVSFDIAEGDIVHFEGLMKGKGNAPFAGSDIFNPEKGVRFDSLHLARYTLKDGTTVVGYVCGDWAKGPKLIQGIKISAKGEVMLIDTAMVNRVTKVEKSVSCYIGGGTQRTVKTRGGQGGVIESSKNVIDTLAVALFVYPDGSMFVGKMAGDIDTDRPDLVEGYYEAADGAVYYAPTENKILLSGKIQNHIFFQPEALYNRTSGFYFQKASPLIE